MVSKQIELTEEQVSALEELAAERNVSTSELIRQAVDEYVGELATFITPEQKARALAAVGCLRGGPPDLAENHDYYLAEAYAE